MIRPSEDCYLKGFLGFYKILFGFYAGFQIIFVSLILKVVPAQALWRCVLQKSTEMFTARVRAGKAKSHGCFLRETPSFPGCRRWK